MLRRVFSQQTDAKSLQDYSRIDVGFTDRGIQMVPKTSNKYLSYKL